MHPHKFAATCFMVALAGCTSQRDTSSVARMEDEITELRNRVGALESTTSVHSAILDGVSQITNPSDGAEIGVSSDGYTVVPDVTGTTPFLVSFVSAEPVANGSRITLKIGNPLSATVTSSKMQFTYGGARDGTKDWSKGLRTQEVTPLKEFPGGEWSTVDVSLPNVRPDQLGYLKLVLMNTGVSLRAKPKTP